LRRKKILKIRRRPIPLTLHQLSESLAPIAYIGKRKICGSYKSDSEMMSSLGQDNRIMDEEIRNSRSNSNMKSYSNSQLSVEEQRERRYQKNLGKSQSQCGLIYGIRSFKKLKINQKERTFRTNTQNPGQIIKLYARPRNINFQNSTNSKLNLSSSLTNLDPSHERRTMTFTVFENKNCFKYPTQEIEKKIGNLNGSPGVDDDNDTTESLIKKQVRNIFKSLVRGAKRETKRKESGKNDSANSLSNGSTMKFDDSKFLGSSFSEESVLNTSISNVSIGEDFYQDFQMSNSRKENYTLMDAENIACHI